MSSKYEVVIGLEVHVQLLTQTKIFCGCSTQFGREPNTQTCPVCLGLPGALPVLNEKVVKFAIMAGLATNCAIDERSIFARKNYFYPDLPKGYQISQFEEPICIGGWLDIDSDNGTKRLGITRIHMEEDAGKLQHGEGAESGRDSYVDLNRACTPLLEVVSEPDMRSADEAIAYLKQLRQIVIYLGISDGNLEEGSFRCDANVSIRPWGQKELGTRAEIKNINSFRFIKQAIEYEVERQVEVLEEGGRVVQETRLYDAESGSTRSMRSKEEANDYRYFPDPDLVPIEISAARVEAVRATLPELPLAKRERFCSEHGLSAQDAGNLIAEQAIAHYFEACLKAGASPKAAANWILGDLSRNLNSESISIDACRVTPQLLVGMLQRIEDGTISGKIAKTVFEKIWTSGHSADAIIESEGLRQVSDSGAIEKFVLEIIAANPAQVADYKSGNEKLFGFFVGQVMKASKGKANPAAVNELLKKKLAE